MKREFKISILFALAFLASLLIVSCSKDDPEPFLEPEVEQTDEPEPVVEPVIETPILQSGFLRDTVRSFILYNGNDIRFQGKMVVNSDTLYLATSDTNLKLGKGYSGILANDTITIYRTELPIIAIDTKGSVIVDEPKIASTFRLVENGEVILESDLGIEIRGGLSQTFPKKSYSIELWADPEESDTVDAPLLGMRDDDDWILDALWNEPIHLRDYVSHELWLRMGRYPYSQEENITLGIKREFCELFIDNEYRGVYYLSEKIDRKQLQLKKYDDETQQVRGELFKGSQWDDPLLFRGLTPFSNSSLVWGGYEAKYPDDMGELDWTNLHAFTDFVVNNDQATFDATIAERLDIDNMVDYFIFMNVTFAHDNWGKNVYTARYDENSPYFFVPWDLDATFGNTWTGERINITNEILINNGLYEKMLLNPEFISALKSRWNDLRGGVLATNEIQGLFDDSYRILQGNRVYDREALVEGFPFNYSDQEIDFIKTWISQRTAYLDGYFANL